MAVPLLPKKIVKKRDKKFKRPQSDRKICLKVLDKLAEAQVNRFSREKKIRRLYFDAKHWLWFWQEDTPQPAEQIQKVRRSQFC